MVQARIHPYFPYFHVDVLADCVLFKPAAGHILGKQAGKKAGALSPQRLYLELLAHLARAFCTMPSCRWQGSHGQS